MPMANKNIFQYRHSLNPRQIKQETNIPIFGDGKFPEDGKAYFFENTNSLHFEGDWDISHFTLNCWFCIVTDYWSMNIPIIQFSKNGENVLYFYNWPYRQQILMNGSWFAERENGLYGQHYVWHYLTISFDNTEKVARLFWDGGLWHTKGWDQGTNTSIDSIGINYPWVITNDNTPIWFDDMYIDFTYAQKDNFTVPTAYRAKPIEKLLAPILYSNLKSTN